MSDSYPGINEPLKPLKIPMGDHKYYDDNSPAFRRDNPSEEGQLWLDTKINFLNEIMKFLPRSTTNTLIKQEYSKDSIKSSSQSIKVAESVYNKDIFEEDLWKGNQSSLLDNLYDKKELTSDENINLARFAGILGLPFDGTIGIGTYIVGDKDNNSRKVTIKDNETFSFLKTIEYTARDGSKKEYDITTADTNYLVPIIKDLKGDDYAKNFREGVNFHASIVDFQHTNASYSNEQQQFVVDANGDGYADQNENGYDSLSTTALSTALYQSEYLQELGIYSPVLDYSEVFSNLMSGSLFSLESLDRTYHDSDRETYNKLHSYLGEQTMDDDSDFKKFLEKISFTVSNGEEDLDYAPNIYDIARKGIDFNEKVVVEGKEVSKWTNKDMFYLSMMMIEARRRYTYAMSTIFGVQSANPDIKDVLMKYADKDIWQCDPNEEYLYMDVKTSSGSYERMYNYFIPVDVGQNITGDIEQKMEKLNWLNKRAVEYLTNESMHALFEEAINIVLKEDNTGIEMNNFLPEGAEGAAEDEEIKNLRKCIDDLNNGTNKNVSATQLVQVFSLINEIKEKSEGELWVALKELKEKAESEQWKALNDFEESIINKAGKMVFSDDKLEGKSFVEEYLFNKTDVSKATIYRNNNNTLEEDEDQRALIINNTIETMKYYFNNHKADMFLILNDKVNNQAKLFNDINTIDKFHYIQYGTVGNVYLGVDDNGKNEDTSLFKKGIVDMGYYSEKIAKTTANSPYISDKKSANESYLGNTEAQYETNMVDKMYFSMIAEMQKMGNFYMMMMFASPEDVNGDGVIDDSDRIDGENSQYSSFNFLSPLAISSNTLSADDRAYLPNSGLFGTDNTGVTTKNFVEVGIISKAKLVTYTNGLAEKTLVEVVDYLNTSGTILEKGENDKGEPIYTFKKDYPNINLELDEPYNILNDKLDKYFKNKKKDGTIWIDALKKIFSEYLAEILFDELKEKELIDEAGYLVDNDGRLMSGDEDVASRVDNLGISNLPLLFIGGEMPLVKKAFKGILAGQDYLFSFDGEQQAESANKRSLYSEIVAGAVQEDYDKISTFIGSLYDRMSSINFEDKPTTTTTTNNLDVTNILSTIDLSGIESIPKWMNAYGTGYLEQKDFDNKIFKTILLNEGIIEKETVENSEKYKILRGIDPNVGLNAFDALVREGYKDEEGNAYTFTREKDIDPLIDKVNKTLLGSNTLEDSELFLWDWFSKVNNIEYSAFGSTLKVNTKDTLLSMFVSRDFVNLVSDIKNLSEIKGFSWEDNDSNSITKTTFETFWGFATMNAPLGDIDIPEKFAVVAESDDKISYTGMNQLEKLVEIMNTKWSINGDAPASFEEIDIAETISKNTCFKTAAQKDFKRLYTKVKNLEIGQEFSFSGDLDKEKIQKMVNEELVQKATYTKVLESSTTHEITLPMLSYDVEKKFKKVSFPHTKYFIGETEYTGTVKKGDNGEYLSEDGTELDKYDLTSITSTPAMGDAFMILWGTTKKTTDWIGLDFKYLGKVNKLGNTLQEEFDRDFVTPFKSLEAGNGLGIEDGEKSLYENLKLIRDRASINLNYLDIRLDKFNQYATQVQDMLKIGSDSGSSTSGKSSLEELFINEFYMKDGFNPLILGAEFQARYVENAFVSDDGNIASNADVYSMVNTVGWYETAGRVALNSVNEKVNKKMDFANFNYSMTNDLVTQYQTVKNKMEGMKYSDSQGKDNIRSAMKRAMRDEFEQTLIIEDLVLMHTGSTEASFKGKGVKITVHSKDGSSIENFIESLASVQFEGKPIVTTIENDNTSFLINTAVMQELTFEKFKELLKEKEVNDTEIRQLYDFLRNIGWNNVAVGANLSAAHSVIEFNSMYMEIILARIMVSIANDELNYEYERRKTEYDEQIAKKKDEEVATQMADAKRSQFKSYLKSLARRK